MIMSLAKNTVPDISHSAGATDNAEPIVTTVLSLTKRELECLKKQEIKRYVDNDDVQLIKLPEDFCAN